jgi:hypothetical protein
LEKSHKLQVKRKRVNSQQEIEQHIPENEISLEDMDLDVDIENIHFPDDEQRLQERKQVTVEVLSKKKSSLRKNHLLSIMLYLTRVLEN